jgi:NAD(P)-dependent dehydrogenase (short-subunit alcohol dehydrogenase family)
MSQLPGKVAVVVGGANGVGRVTAELLASEGAKVAVFDIDDAGSAAVVENIRKAGTEATAVHCDVSQEVSVKAAVEAVVSGWGGIDVLYNSAAPMHLASRDLPVHLQDVEVWDETFAVITRGAFLTSKHVLPHMVGRGGGSIVYTVSTAAQIGQWSRHAYGASKAAVINLMLSVATRYGKQGVRSNAIAPGVIRSFEGSPPEVAEKFDASGAAAEWLKLHLTPRLGVSMDVARTVLFLSADGGAFITGQVIGVDGGMLSWAPWSRLQTDEGYPDAVNPLAHPR